jgi:hypothetical protein
MFRYLFGGGRQNISPLLCEGFGLQPRRLSSDRISSAESPNMLPIRPTPVRSPMVPSRRARFDRYPVISSRGRCEYRTSPPPLDETMPAYPPDTHKHKPAAVQGPATLRAFTAPKPGWRGSENLALRLAYLALRRESGLLALFVVLSINAPARRRSPGLEVGENRLKRAHPTTSPGSR